MWGARGSLIVMMNLPDGESRDRVRARPTAATTATASGKASSGDSPELIAHGILTADNPRYHRARRQRRDGGASENGIAGTPNRGRRVKVKTRVVKECTRGAGIHRLAKSKFYRRCSRDAGCAIGWHCGKNCRGRLDMRDAQ